MTDGFRLANTSQRQVEGQAGPLRAVLALHRLVGVPVVISWICLALHPASH